MLENFTDRSRRVLQLAKQEAARLGHTYVGTEHILLGLIKEGSGVAAFTLKNLGLDLRKVREEVLSLLGTQEPAATTSPGAWSLSMPLNKEPEKVEMHGPDLYGDKFAKALQDSVNQLWGIEPEKPMTIKQELDKLGVTEAVKKLLESGKFIVGTSAAKLLKHSDLRDPSPAELKWAQIGGEHPTAHDTILFTTGFEHGQAYEQELRRSMYAPCQDSGSVSAK